MSVARSTIKPIEPKNDPVAGAMWVFASMATLAGLAACAKALAAEGMHPFQIVFFRNLFAALVFSPLLLTRGLALFETSQLSLYAGRCAISLFSMLTWFYALAVIPLGELTAISFLAPLFGTLGAIVILKETVRARRWTALVVGFIGALIILRPGMSPLGYGQLTALLAAMSSGLVAILVKQLTARDDPNKIVFLTHLLLVPMSLVPALFIWKWPPLSQIWLVLGMGFFATAGHMMLVRGYAATDASLVMTFEFSKLPFATAIAYFFFGETIDVWTWVGAIVIIASATYIARREAQVRAARLAERPDVPPGPPSTG
ncbi:MAG TPA: DMT family transporter [Hyphomicrobiaceae bacterium]|nr:DMT family transporter [Hyphomicrobiaceae bacterium]